MFSMLDDGSLGQTLQAVGRFLGIPILEDVSCGLPLGKAQELAENIFLALIRELLPATIMFCLLCSGCLVRWARKEERHLAERLEAREIERMFRELDADGNGALSIDEVEKLCHLTGAGKNQQSARRSCCRHLSDSLLCRRRGPPPSAARFSEMDTNGDGSVSFNEFHAWYQMNTPNRRQRVRELFDALDKDGDGLLERDEIWRLCGNVGLRSLHESSSASARLRRRCCCGRPAAEDALLDVSFDEMGASKEGKVTFEKFHAWYATRVDIHGRPLPPSTIQDSAKKDRCATFSKAPTLELDPDEKSSGSDDDRGVPVSPSSRSGIGFRSNPLAIGVGIELAQGFARPVASEVAEISESGSEGEFDGEFDGRDIGFFEADPELTAPVSGRRTGGSVTEAAIADDKPDLLKLDVGLKDFQQHGRSNPLVAIGRRKVRAKHVAHY
jgi:Ca2+-binding EF-hand superfamily protein